MRLLRCIDCRSLEQLPDAPRGTDPHHLSEGQDPLLDHLVAAHRFPNGEPHKGDLLQVEDAHWQDSRIREEILARINSAGQGLGDDFYALRDTFHEDALKCFSEHNRPQGRCIDWCRDSKKLGRPTKEGQRWQKENYKAPAMFLCMFCPVASHVMQEQRAQRGDYV